MKPSLLLGTMLAALALPLAACATSKTPKLAVCDGKPKHRREANPYGSVLPGAPMLAPTAAPQGGGQHPDALPPPPPPSEVSAVTAPAHFASC